LHLSLQLISFARARTSGQSSCAVPVQENFLVDPQVTARGRVLRWRIGLRIHPERVRIIRNNQRFAVRDIHLSGEIT
jgi:hypothetical protein